jgi:hydrogenase expression/formation protein HypC
MCLAVPSKVIKIEKEWATVKSGDHTHKANLSLLKDVKVGDYLLVHTDLALNKVEEKEAKRILKMIKSLNNSGTCAIH